MAVATTCVVTSQFEDDRRALLVHGPASGVTASGYQLSAPSHTRTMHNPSDLIELARVVQTGDNFLRAGVSGKLELIADQIKMLQAQARQVLEDGRRDVELNHARCNFERKVGKTYHLYRRPGLEFADERTTAYWSMISPAEYRGKPPHEFVGSYRLEPDMGWTAVANIAARDERRRLDPVLLGLAAPDGTFAPARLGGNPLQLTFAAAT